MRNEERKLRIDYQQSVEIVLNLIAASRGRTMETELYNQSAFAFISLLFSARLH